MHLRVLSQKTILYFLSSLEESDPKLFVADEGSFVHWLGQGDCYDAFSLIRLVQHNWLEHLYEIGGMPLSMGFMKESMLNRRPEYPFHNMI